MRIAIINPCAGGSGHSARHIISELSDSGHQVAEYESIRLADIPAITLCDHLILNEGLQGIRRSYLKLIKRLCGKRIRITMIIRNFRFAKSNIASCASVLDRIIPVSHSLAQLVDDFYEGVFSHKCCVMIEPPFGDFPKITDAPQAATRILVPRAYKLQHKPLLDIADKLHRMGFLVTVVRNRSESNDQFLFGSSDYAFDTIPFQNSLSVLYQHGDVVLMGGQYLEGWGLIFNEAVIHGKIPVVIGISGGYIEQAILSGVGFMVDGLDTTDSSQRIRNFLISDSNPFDLLNDCRKKLAQHANLFRYDTFFLE